MKKLLLSAAILFLSFQAFSLSVKDFSLSVEPLFGMKYGQIDEYVFLKKSNFSDDKLSELNWEIKPLLYYGVKISGSYKGFFEESHFTAGIPMKTGLMKDSDWLNAGLGITPEKAAGRNYKTCYSEHDNILDYDISFGFKAGYDFSVMDIFSIKPSLAFQYENIRFTGEGGKGLYGYDSYNNGEGYYQSYKDVKKFIGFSGRVITYKRVSDYLWLGSDFSVKLPKNFEVNTGFFVAPYVYAVSYDSHLAKQYDYADKTQEAFGAFKWNLGAEYKISERQSVSLNASYFYMRVLRGDNYQKKSSESAYDKSSEVDGGAGARYFDLALSYKYKIF